MTTPTPSRPSHQVQLEVDILTDEFAVPVPPPAPPPAFVLLVGVDPSLRDHIRGVLPAYPRHTLHEAQTVVALMQRLLLEQPNLADELRRLLR